METRLNVNADSLLAELDWIRSLALQLVRDVAKADDLVQETLLAALERQPDDRGPLRPWLGVVLRRRASLMRRGDVRRRAREEREARSEDLPSAHELAARAETQRDVVDAVLALSEPYRSTVLLRYFEGLAPQEIARRRGIPAATVRTHLSRGLDDLRRELDKRHEGDSRSWCLALIPLAAERAGLKSAVTSSASATLVLLFMNTWLKLAVAAVLVALCFFLWLPTDGLTPTEATASATARPSIQPLVRPSVVRASSDSLEVERVAVEARSNALITRRLSGRVVDRTGTPLVEYAVEIDNEDGTVESLMTDAGGYFESKFERLPKTVTVTLVGDVRHPWRIDGARSMKGLRKWTRQEVNWDGESTVTLVDSVSTILSVRFEVPAGYSPSDFDAVLLDKDPRTATHGLLLMSYRTYVHSTPEGLFIRVSDQMGMNSGRKVVRLESRDGVWAGQAWVDFGTAHSEQAIYVILQQASSLRLAFSHPAGEKVTKPRLTIKNLASGRVMRRDARDFVRDPLSIDVGALDPGGYHVSFEARGVRRIDITFVLGAGDRHEDLIELTPLVDLERVHGQLRSRSGRYESPVTVQLTDACGSVRSVQAKWTIGTDGNRVAPFVFDDVAPGERVIALKGDRVMPWSPSPGTVSAVANELVFECDDMVRQQVVWLRVRDARIGGPVSRVEIEMTVDGVEVEHRRATFEVGDAWELTGACYVLYQGAELRWRVSAPGFQPESGDSSTFVASGDELVQVVALEPVQ